MNEIEDFLRRIAKEKLRQFVGGDDEEIIDAEIVENSGITYTADVVVEDQATSRDRDTGSVFTGDSSSFGTAIRRADDRMDEHLHEVFEHKLGQLGSTTDRAEDVAMGEHPTPAPEPPVIDLTALLRSPESVRNAIILSEIIKRPEERWT